MTINWCNLAIPNTFSVRELWSLGNLSEIVGAFISTTIRQQSPADPPINLGQHYINSAD